MASSETIRRKIRVARASGLPLDKEKVEAYRAEFRAATDSAYAKCGKDMLRLQKLLDRVERVLRRKYELVGQWDSAMTAEEWRAKINEYGNVMVVAAQDGGIAYIIMDDQDILL